MLHFCKGMGLKVAVDVSPDAPELDRNAVLMMTVESPVRFVSALTDKEQADLRRALGMVDMVEEEAG